MKENNIQEQIKRYESGAVESPKSFASIEAEKDNLIAGVNIYEKAENDKLNEKYLVLINNKHNNPSEKYQLEKTLEIKLNEIKKTCKDKITEINENYKKRIEQLNA